MSRKVLLLCIVILSFVFCGCVNKANIQCKPVLFPMPEHGYKAEPHLLDDTFAKPDGREIIEYSGLKIAIPEGWHHEKVFKGKRLKLYKNRERFFLFSSEHSEMVSAPTLLKYLNDTDCNWNSLKSNTPRKTSRDFYTDLYLFTDRQLSDDPESWPWQYMILWFKRDLLHHAERMIYYKGRNLEAFQLNKAPYVRSDLESHTSIEIFHNRMTAEYYRIGANFADDVFFADFINRLNDLNP